MQYFMQVKTARPDVMMEASDVTGELRLCMQVIATAGKEKAVYGTSILDRENDFRKLMEIFTQLNHVVYRRHHTMERQQAKVEMSAGNGFDENVWKHDTAFLQENQISDVAIEVAESVYQAVMRAREENPEFFEKRNDG